MQKQFLFKCPDNLVRDGDYAVVREDGGNYKHVTGGGYYYGLPPKSLETVELKEFIPENFNPIETAPKEGYFYAWLLDMSWMFLGSMSRYEPIYDLRKCSLNGDKLDIWYLDPRHKLKSDECAADGSILVHELPHQCGAIGPARYKFLGWIK